MGRRKIKHKKNKVGVFLLKDGQRVAVMRPEDPKLALATARKIQEDEKYGIITHAEAASRFNQLVTLQPYTYLGLAGRKAGSILDHDGKGLPGKVKPGDSFIDYASAAQAYLNGKSRKEFEVEAGAGAGAEEDKS